ncbi:hypothetical protein H6775_01340 [Candidatus Nomurabacteria bacterium]|nr:hypothetical protein [Candidatus Nomurabacteria bacterium]
MESTITIPSVLVITISVLVIVILIAVIVFVISLAKVVVDIRRMTQNLSELSAELREKPLLELLKDDRFRKNLLGDFRKNIIRILPFVTSALAFLATRKMKKGKK